MSIQVQPIRDGFAAEVRGIELTRPVSDSEISEVVDAIDRFAVLVFKNQHINDEQQISFSERFGSLETVTAHRVIKGGTHHLDLRVADVSNVDAEGRIRPQDDRRRVNSFADRFWHTDSSFKPVVARYSLLSGRVVPPEGGETEFADMRAAYETLSTETKDEIAEFVAEHWLLHSRGTLVGFSDFSDEQRAAFPPVRHKVVRTSSGNSPRSLYLGSHASHIVGMPLPEGRVLLYDLTEHATQRKFVYSHSWTAGDLVMWDNRCTLHRARAFKNMVHVRVMRRTTVSNAT